MKRKSETSSSSSATTSSASLKSLIHDHNLFFDNLVSLIPGKFYLPNLDADSKPYFKGLSKVAQASLKKQTKENIKLARRNRHDPEKVSQFDTLHLLQQSITKINQETDENDENDENDASSSKSGTYEELRQRLRKKIESLRGNRGASDKSYKRISLGDDDDSNKLGGEEKKRKRDNDDVDEEEKVGMEDVLEKGIEFGKVKIGDDDKEINKKKKRKIPKVKELERVTRLEEMKRENPVVAKKESWKAATSRALGAKVHDDPRLLKESIKKENRKRVKNAEKWKERVERTTKTMKDKQQKRTHNIAERAKDKKARKIAKREKKLMRPGFEGRKEDYITKD